MSNVKRKFKLSRRIRKGY